MKRYRFSLQSLFLLTLVAALFSLALHYGNTFIGKSLFIVFGAAVFSIAPARWAIRRYAGISRILSAGFLGGGTFGVVAAVGFAWSGSRDPLEFFLASVVAGGLAGLGGGIAGFITGFVVAYLGYRQGNLNDTSKERSR